MKPVRKIDPQARLQSEVLLAFRHPTQDHGAALDVQLNNLLETVDTIQSIITSNITADVELAIPSESFYGFLNVMRSQLRVSIAYCGYLMSEAMNRETLPVPQPGTVTLAQLNEYRRLVEATYPRDFAGIDTEAYNRANGFYHKLNRQALAGISQPATPAAGVDAEAVQILRGLLAEMRRIYLDPQDFGDIHGMLEEAYVISDQLRADVAGGIQ